MIFAKTKSVCPICLRVLPAEKEAERNGHIYLKKKCPEHGDFKTLIWEGNLQSYLNWQIENKSIEAPIDGRKPEKGCPRDCGLCTEHLRKGCCMLLELTKRCNLRCPVCFASAGDSDGSDLPLSEIERQYDFLMAHGGPFNIQLSGGEPTMRDDLPEIIVAGKSRGFSYFQLNTNGLRLAEDEGYAQILKEAGLSCVFLQFDSLNDKVYETLRGARLLEKKLQAIDRCEAAGLGVVLVPVIAPDVNEEEIGDLIRFAASRMPAVRGVHFQPVSYFGRNSLDASQPRITIPRMLRLIEEQTEGLMTSKDFGGGEAENPYCSFHASFMRRKNGRFDALPRPAGNSSCCCSTTSDDSRLFVANQWGGYSPAPDPSPDRDETGLTETSSLDIFLEYARQNTFPISGMLFQDAWNLDLQRLTSADGRYLYRR